MPNESAPHTPYESEGPLPPRGTTMAIAMSEALSKKGKEKEGEKKKPEAKMRKPKSLSAAAVGEGEKEQEDSSSRSVRTKSLQELRNERNKVSPEYRDFLQKLDTAYFELADTLRNKYGMGHLQDLPEWNEAIEARERIQKLSRLYGQEKEDRRKEEINAEIEQLAAEFVGPISDRAEEAAAKRAQEISEGKRSKDVRLAPEPLPAEPSPAPVEPPAQEKSPLEEFVHTNRGAPEKDSEEEGPVAPSEKIILDSSAWTGGEAPGAPPENLPTGSGLQAPLNAERSQEDNSRDVPLSNEGTPKEWRTRLRGLIRKAEKREESRTQGAEKMGTYLAVREQELDKKAEGLGKGAFEIVKNAGEWYRKLPLKYKLGVSAALIGASVATGGTGFFFSLITAAQLGQRALASAGTYTLVEGLLEKRLERKETESGTERSRLASAFKHGTAVGAALFVGSGAAGYLLKEGFEAAGGDALSHEVYARVHEVLAGSSSAAVHPLPAEAVPAGAGAPPAEVPPPTAEAAAPVSPEIPPATGSMHAATSAVPPTPPAAESLHAAASEVAPPPTVPDISIEASKGHGYEFMVKRAWEALQEKHMDPNSFDKGSDIYKLLTADKDSIDKLVHQIAADPKHGFFNADGTSVQIHPGDHLTIGVDGQLHLDGAEHAAPNAKITPPFPAHEAPPIPPPHPPVPEAPAAPEPPIATPIEVHPAPESHAAIENPSPTEPRAGDGFVRTNAGDVVTTPEGTPVRIESVAAAHPVVETGVPGHEVITNAAGIEVPVDAAHLYAGSGREVFAYGGTVAEKMKLVQEYLQANPKSIIYSADANGAHRVPWFLGPDGKVAAGVPERTSGFFGFGSDWKAAPSPDEFTKVLK